MVRHYGDGIESDAAVSLLRLADDAGDEAVESSRGSQEVPALKDP
jgi:hypothetical protein